MYHTLRFLTPILLVFILQGTSSCQRSPNTTTNDMSPPPYAPPTCVEDTTALKLLPEEPPPPGAVSEFSTDFSRHTVPYAEIFSGGPTKDAIPALDNSEFVTPIEANLWLKPNEPVIFVEIGNDSRAYPLQLVMWHEIVNDVVNNQPILVTFCPLCNTALAFDRTLDGKVLSFGTTGRLRFSNLVMYDRQTESWWQQGTGNAIAGEYTGRCITPLPASIISWNEFREAYPNGKVLSRETGYARDYGRNPYVGYDGIAEYPFLYRGPVINNRLPPMARVVGIRLNGENLAFPYSTLESVRVANDSVGGVEIAVFWSPGTASGLDRENIADGKEVGGAIAYLRMVEGRRLDFVEVNGQISDSTTMSVWNIFGEAIEGPLRGKRLERIPTFNYFWFSWSAFHPTTRLFTL